MHIVVCVKQVPDTTDVRIDPDTNTLVREGVPSILNPYDRHACEEAVRLKERYNGHVTAISMGPPQASAALADCIALGCDRAVLASDRAFAGSDTWATSYAVSHSITQSAKEWGPVSVVLCGKQAIDGDTAQVGPGIARRLNLPQITYCSKVIEIDEKAGKIRAERRLEKGIETVETEVPVLLTCVEQLNEPRYSSLPNVIRSIKYKCITWGVKDVAGDPEDCGLKGSPTAVARVFAPPEREPGEIIDAPTVEEKVTKLLDAMEARIRHLAGTATTH